MCASSASRASQTVYNSSFFLPLFPCPAPSASVRVPNTRAVAGSSLTRARKGRARGQDESETLACPARPRSAPGFRLRLAPSRTCAPRRQGHRLLVCFPVDLPPRVFPQILWRTKLFQHSFVAAFAAMHKQLYSPARCSLCCASTPPRVAGDRCKAPRGKAPMLETRRSYSKRAHLRASSSLQESAPTHQKTRALGRHPWRGGPLRTTPRPWLGRASASISRGPKLSAL